MLLLSVALTMVGAPAVASAPAATPVQNTATAEPSDRASDNPSAEESPSAVETADASRDDAVGDDSAPTGAAPQKNPTGAADAPPDGAAPQSAAGIPGIEDLTGKGHWVAADKRWRWQGSDGAFARSLWARIDGKIYRFDDAGYMQTGWWRDGQSWYHFASSGVLSTGWTQLDSTWYYLDPDTGIMATGPLIQGAVTYFLAPNGAMVTGWFKHADGWRFYLPGGQRASGWQRDGSTWYYLDPDTGIMATGWLSTADGHWFYLHSSGAMATGWLKLGSAWYYLDPAGGVMATGWLKLGSAWYYLDPSSGAMATGTRTIGGSQYSFTSSGVWIGYRAPNGYLQPVSEITSLGWATNSLTLGMNGVKVRIVQQRLGLWYSTKLASVDANLQAAVRNFQRRAGLPQTGIVDETTWNALDTGYSWWIDQYQETPISLSATRNERIDAMIGYAWNQMGSSYTWGGAGPYSLGFDCSGLALQSLYRAGLDPQPINVHRHAWPDYRTSQELYNHPAMMHVPLSQRQRGDLIFYTTNGIVTHVAIYLGDNQVIHTDWMGRPARVDYITVGYGWSNMTADVVRPFP